MCLLHPDIVDAMVAAGATAQIVAAAYRAAYVLQIKQDADAEAEADRKRERQRAPAAQRQRNRRARLRRGNAVGDLFEPDDSQRYIDASIAANASLAACHVESHAVPPAPPKEEESSSSSLSKESYKSLYKKERGILCTEEWKPKQNHYQEGEAKGYSSKQVNDFAADMRRWSQANKHRSIARKADWDANFSGWIQRQKPILTVVQGGRPRIDPDGYTARYYRDRGVDVNDAEAMRKWRLKNASG